MAGAVSSCVSSARPRAASAACRRRWLSLPMAASARAAGGADTAAAGADADTAAAGADADAAAAAGAASARTGRSASATGRRGGGPAAPLKRGDTIGAASGASAGAGAGARRPKRNACLLSGAGETSLATMGSGGGCRRREPAEATSRCATELPKLFAAFDFGDETPLVLCVLPVAIGGRLRVLMRELDVATDSGVRTRGTGRPACGGMCRLFGRLPAGRWNTVRKLLGSSVVAGGRVGSVGGGVSGSCGSAAGAAVPSSVAGEL